MKKIKVLLIHNIVSPHVTTLFKELSKLVDLKVLYCAQKEDNRIWTEDVNGFKHKILPNFAIKFRGRDLFTYFVNPTIIHEIRIAKPDVVMLSGWDIFAYQIAFLYCKLKKIKVVLLSGSTKYESSWRRNLSVPLVKLIVKGCNAWLSYGTRAKEYLVSLGAKEDLVFNYMHSTNVGYFVKETKIFSDNGTSILFYGQLIERKGIDILIEAFSQARKKINNIKLTIVGSGPYKDELINIAKKEGVDRFVKFVENPGDRNVKKYFSSADIFVLPSREEVWGLVVNMAMQAGLPVIVSNTAGCSADLIKDGVNGYTFRSESATDLADKIVKVVNNKAKMGEASLNIIKSYTPKHSAHIMFEAVNSCVKNE